ncbi:MAG: hypothetical protein LBM25_02260 [Bacteroidales bacterium]|jgi:hypothetical protein|nr:hypothetical protein [Bacteroidales bacterium]
MKQFQIKNLIFFALLLLFLFESKAQIVPVSTEDYGLMGYPMEVKYQKYETDTNYNQKEKQVSFIDDYTMEFDKNRRLIKRQHFIKGNKDRYTIFTYDTITRNLLKEELFEASGKVVSTITHSYNYLGRLEEVVSVEYPLSLGGANKMVSKQTYKWNRKGQLSEYTTFGDDASKQKTIEYFYGPQDSLIYTLTTYGFNKNVEKTTYKRDFKHYVIEVTFFRNDKQTRRETFLLNDKNQIIEKKIFDPNDKITLTYNYTYDEHNYVLSEIAKDKKGRWAIEYYYKYDKDKFFNWTKKTTYDGWEPKYIETRKITYFDKEHFYQDLKDFDQKKVIFDNE